MAKKSAKRTGQKRSPAAASGRGGRKAAGAPTPRGRAASKAKTAPARPGKRKAAKAAKKTTRAGGMNKAVRARRGAGASRKKTATSRKGTAATRKETGPSRKTAGGTRKSTGGLRKRAAAPRRGGTGREAELAQTPETGRTRKGPVNPLPTRRSTGTPSGAGASRSRRLEGARQDLREREEGVPTPPSSLDLDRFPSAARSGRRHLHDARAERTETSPVLTGGDVDADWGDAYAVGDEAPGGDNPTPDQDRVDDIGKALGVQYQDNEELRASDKIAERDRHRWELDPASSEDYPDRDQE